MKAKITNSIVLVLALSGVCHAATVATVAVYSGSVTVEGVPNPADTFTKLSAGGGFDPNGTRIGLATVNKGSYEVAGTSNAPIWTITGAGTLTMSYYLDNTVKAAFRLGIQGLYDGSTIASTAGGVDTALGDFAALKGVTATYPTTYPPSLDTGDGGDGAPAEPFTTTYVIAEGSDAIGKSVAVGFYSAWNGAGGYIFGKESGPNDVVLDFVAIPEPSTAILGALGVLALLRRRR